MAGDVRSIYTVKDGRMVEVISDAPATADKRGMVKPDGVTTSVDANGGITALGSTPPDAATIVVKDGKLVVKDIAIGGDAGDRARARGQIGDAYGVVDGNIDDSKTAGIFAHRGNSISGTPPNGYSNVPVGIIPVFKLNDLAFQQYLIRDSGNNARMCIRALASEGSWGRWCGVITSSLLGDGIRYGSNGVASVPEYDGATASDPGTAGLVPPATSAERDRFFRGDGTYVEVLSRKYDARVGDLHFYVRADGNDANDGLADSPERAFRTVTHAAEIINAQVEYGNHGVYVHIGAGEFDGGVKIHNLPSTTYVELSGAGKGSTRLTRTNSLNLYLSSGGASIMVKDLDIVHTRTAGVGSYICHLCGGDVRFSSVAFYEDDQSDQVDGDTGDEMVVVTGPAIASLHGDCEFHSTVSGNPKVKLGAVYVFNGASLMCSGNVSFDGGFNYMVQAITGGFINVSQAVFSGSPTGKRYNASSGGVIYTNGKGPDFIPGSTAGSVQTESGALYY